MAEEYGKISRGTLARTDEISERAIDSAAQHEIIERREDGTYRHRPASALEARSYSPHASVWYSAGGSD